MVNDFLNSMLQQSGYLGMPVIKQSHPKVHWCTTPYFKNFIVSVYLLLNGIIPVSVLPKMCYNVSLIIEPVLSYSVKKFQSSQYTKNVLIFCVWFVPYLFYSMYCVDFLISYNCKLHTFVNFWDCPYFKMFVCYRLEFEQCKWILSILGAGSNSVCTIWMHHHNEIW